MFCFTEIGFKKDRREFWSAVAERLGVPFGRIVMIGDSLEHDVLAPRRVGLQGVWFNRGDIPRPASAEPVPIATGLCGFAGMVVRALS